MQHLRPDVVDDAKGYLGSVLRRIDVHAKRPLAERRVNDLEPCHSLMVTLAGTAFGEIAMDSDAIHGPGVHSSSQQAAAHCFRQRIVHHAIAGFCTRLVHGRVGGHSKILKLKNWLPGMGSNHKLDRFLKAHNLLILKSR